MANETDFLDLYGKLRLSPDCGLLEFKQAYRRYVSQWHPDRLAPTHFDDGAAARLQQLTAQYAAAMDFQRRHGRLPGATGARLHAAARPVRSSVQQDAPRQLSVLPRRSHARLLAVLAVIVVGVVLWSAGPLPSEPEDMPADNAPASETDLAASAVALPLTLGDTSASVRIAEGTPLVMRADRWEYGPSWIRFQQDQVVDWYSSPLRPLKTATSRSPGTQP